MGTICAYLYIKCIKKLLFPSDIFSYITCINTRETQWLFQKMLWTPTFMCDFENLPNTAWYRNSVMLSPPGVKNSVPYLNSSLGIMCVLKEGGCDLSVTCCCLSDLIINVVIYCQYKFCLPSADGFEHDRPDCAAVLTRHFGVATVTISYFKERQCIYLYMNVKVMERRGYERVVRLNTQEQFRERQRISDTEKLPGVTERSLHLSACPCRTGKGSCCGIFTNRQLFCRDRAYLFILTCTMMWCCAFPFA